MRSVVACASAKGGGSSPARTPAVNYANPGTYVPPAKSGYVNYAQVGRPKTTHKRAWTVAAGACAVLAVASIGMGVRELCVPAIEGARLHSMSRVATSGENGAPAANGADTSEQTDWNALHATNGDVCAWLTVMGTDIDYAVCQGDDNEWYLHHDVYGTPNSLCGVFADYRCDVGSANTVIYGHTVSTGGMFAPISDVYHPGRLAEIGDVVMDTPSTGQVFYHPLCAMSVENDYGKIQQFDMQPSTRDFRSWVRTLLDDADERVEGADEMAARANKVLALVCCSADTNTRRSVLISVC